MRLPVLCARTDPVPANLDNTVRAKIVPGISIKSRPDDQPRGPYAARKVATADSA